MGVLGPSGDLVNRYSYDPFGRMLEFDEKLPQDFTFIGQWGVTADREFRDIYWMRSRHYDAQLGRFLSFDPLGKSAFTKYLKPFNSRKMLKFNENSLISPSLSNGEYKRMWTNPKFILWLYQNCVPCETIHLNFYFIYTFSFMLIKCRTMTRVETQANIYFVLFQPNSRNSFL